VKLRLTLLVLLAALAAAQPREKRITPVAGSERDTFARQGRVAVLAGIGDYPRTSSLSALRYPAADAETLTAALEAQGYNVVALKDSEATKSAVLRAIRNAGEVLDQGQGTLVFFFSGHGFEVAGKNYLATYGANSLTLSQSGLALEEVDREMRATGAARRIMWIDACRNNTAKSAEAARSFAAFQAAAGTRILFSTRAGRVSYENDDLRHGVFTYFLLEGLRGEAAGSDGLVTFRDLADYVTYSVRSYGLKRNEVQVPYDAGEAAGDFLLAGSVVRDPGPRTVRQPQPEPESVKPATGTLVVSTDSSATITIDGDNMGTLGANQTKRFPTGLGSHIVIAASTEQSSLTQRKVVDVRKDEQQAVLVEFARDLEAGRRQTASEQAAAQRREVEGLWTHAAEGDDHYTDGDRGPFHQKISRSVQITEDGDGFRIIWQEQKVVSNLDKPGGFTEDLEGTFRVKRAGNQVSGYAESARRRYDGGAWLNLTGVLFSGTVSGGNRMQVDIVWTRDSGGQKIEWSSPTLQKQ